MQGSNETEAERVERYRFDEFCRARDRDGNVLEVGKALELAQSDTDLHRFYDLLAAGCDLQTAFAIVS